MIKTEKFFEAGGYDERIFLYYEETVLGIRMKQIKMQTYLMTDCSFLHKHSTSIGKTFKSGIKRACLLWRSKRYVFKEYYNSSFVEMLIFDTIKIPFVVIAEMKSFS